VASVTDICNLALAHLGDEAAVASIYPPDGSAQASHCARFYPLSRDAVLGHPVATWGFALRRAPLALLAFDAAPWEYAYRLPADLVRAVAVRDPGATDDNDPQPYVLGAGEDGLPLLLTNQPDAVLAYISRVEDPTLFSALFTTALSYLLASHLAGPVLKGETGRAVAKEMGGMAHHWLSLAATAESNQGQSNHQHLPAWIKGR
jgi:hypothetical protein